MIAYIRGKLTSINPALAIIETPGGVAYNIHISLATFTDVKELEEITLLTHYHVKEDGHLLFGFSSEEERTIFRLLISVSGVGVNTARLILSSLSVSELINAISSEQVRVIQSVKGIGQKSAQKIIIDLKDKIGKTKLASLEKNSSVSNNNKYEALSALVSLGFSKASSESILDKIIASEGLGYSVEELIKKALKLL